jgi:hypothetical protein
MAEVALVRIYHLPPGGSHLAYQRLTARPTIKTAMLFDILNALQSLVVGTVGAGLAAAVIRRHFDKSIDMWRSQRSWQERAISELFGPIYVQLDRTKRAFERWDGKNLYLEGEVIRNGNLAIRDLLLTKSHLIPPDLRDAASELLLHYDVWLEEFERVKGSRAAGHSDTTYVFVGPKGYPFPSEADEQFRKKFRELWNRLYGDQAGKMD